MTDPVGPISPLQGAPPTSPAPSAFPPLHLLLALLVVAVWGTNFVIIHEGLEQFPPLVFGTLRFFFAVFPAIFFLPRPPLRWRYFAGFGLFIGAGQFGLLFIAMNGHISPGLASLVVQAQVIFTIGLSMIITGERLRNIQFFALALCLLGLGLIASSTDGDTSFLGLALVLGAAFSWACGNLVVKAAGSVRMVDFVVWSSLFSVPPLLLLSLVAEGPQAFVQSVEQANLAGWAALLWQAVGNTLFGYAAWNWLLSRHPAAMVAPLALLVPIFGMSASALLLGEPMPMWKLAATALIIGGLAINLLAPLLTRSTTRRPGKEDR